MPRLLIGGDTTTNPSATANMQGLWRSTDWRRGAAQSFGIGAGSLIVLDYPMPDLNGVDVAKLISAMFPRIPILMVTLHLSRQPADAARRAGVRGACASQDIGAVVKAVDLLLYQHTYFPAMPGEGPLSWIKAFQGK